ncbi:hypothetical protein BDV12DRAFT_207765 [Aspergillus spectabilis]
MSSPLSQSPYLRLAGAALGTIPITFGINAIINPEHALPFFEFDYPTTLAERSVIDKLMLVYGARDIFIGLAAYITAYYGNTKSLGWTLIAVSGVACRQNRLGEWNHWGYASMLTVLGSLLVVIFDRK